MSAPDEERHWIVLFDSIHYVLAAERVFDGVEVPRVRPRSGAWGLGDARVKARAVYRPDVGRCEEAMI